MLMLVYYLFSEALPPFYMPLDSIFRPGAWACDSLSPIKPRVGAEPYKCSAKEEASRRKGNSIFLISPRERKGICS